MGQALGLLTMGVQLGVEAILVKPKRAIGPFVAHATLRETHTDELQITDHPVEDGAAITDHAFKKPAELMIECLWSDAPQNIGVINGLIGAVTGTIGGISSILSGSAPNQMHDVYAKLLELQQKRERFDVFTGKRAYTDMLVRTLVVHTDKETENVLSVTAHLRQILIVKTQTAKITAPQASQKLPGSTSPLIDKGLKQVSDGLPSVNVAAAAQSLVTSSIADISAQAVGGLPTLDGATAIFSNALN